jgi:hypothetical protein
MGHGFGLAALARRVGLRIVSPGGTIEKTGSADSGRLNAASAERKLGGKAEAMPHKLFEVISRYDINVSS